MVAAGTSTPTSTTVVATSSPISPDANCAHHAIFLGALHLAMHQADPVAEPLLQALEALRRIGQMFCPLRFGFLHQRTIQ